MLNYPNTHEPRTIDYPEVLERIGGDTAFLQELLNIYFTEFAEKQTLIKEAIGQSNFTMIKELGHSLKGSSANLSLVSLRQASFDLETAGREKKLEAAVIALRSLETEFQRLKDFLEKNPPPVSTE
jgi:HPt (histidine-containing phosphotransfer) domain-containing protein